MLKDEVYFFMILKFIVFIHFFIICTLLKIDEMLSMER